MRKLSTAFIVCLSLVVGGLLFAQDEGEGGDDAAEEKKADDKKSEKTADVGEDEKVEMTPDEMTIKADELIKAMRKGLKEVIKVQKVARKQQDVIKLNCVNDKLLQVKQLLNIAEGANTDMAEAIANADETERYHQYGKVTISGEQITGLVEEAKNCLGEELIYLGALQVDVDRPDVEDHEDPFDDDTYIEPPAYASPFF